jgi:hypothetical protein
MSYRVKVLGAEAALPTSVGAATSFSEATVVRLVNTSASNDYVVTVVETQSGPSIGSFTVLRQTVEVIQKQSSHCVYASNASVLGVKVGFTN